MKITPTINSIIIGISIIIGAIIISKEINHLACRVQQINISIPQPLRVCTDDYPNDPKFRVKVSGDEGSGYPVVIEQK